MRLVVPRRELSELPEPPGPGGAHAPWPRDSHGHIRRVSCCSLASVNPVPALHHPSKGTPLLPPSWALAQHQSHLPTGLSETTSPPRVVLGSRKSLGPQALVLSLPLFTTQPSVSSLPSLPQRFHPLKGRACPSSALF